MRKIIAVPLFIFFYIVGAGATHGMMRMLVPKPKDSYEATDNSILSTFVAISWPIGLPGYLLYKGCAKLGGAISDSLQPSKEKDDAFHYQPRSSSEY